MKTIRLQLGEDWYYFDSQRFRPVGLKQNFISGDLLYRDSEFYLVHQKKKLKKISWTLAGKKIYEHIQDTQLGRNFNISKQKILFAFKINQEEEVQTCIKPRTFPRNIENLSTNPTNILESSTSSPKTDSFAERRAKNLLFHIVNNDDRLELRGIILYVSSINGQIYKIFLSSGEVRDMKNVIKCVWVANKEPLPLYDKIISKALTIAYAPKRIHTIR